MAETPAPAATPAVTTTPTSPATTAPSDGKAPDTGGTGAAPTADGKPAPTLLNNKEAVSSAPEKYEEFKAPDGYEIDKGRIEKVLPVFKDLNLNQEQAQKLVDIYSEISKEAAEAQLNFINETRANWIKEIKADKDIGHKIPQVTAEIGKMLKTLGPLEAGFREAMDMTGVGDHPAFIRAFHKLAQAFTEGTHVPAGGPPKTNGVDPKKPVSGASAMYPNLPSAS